MPERTAGWQTGALRVAETIGRAIIEGAYAEGEQLPREHELAARLAVSRTMLREAMKALAAKSMVQIAPRRGTRVLPRSRWNVLDRDVLHWAGTALEGDAAFMSELLRMRRIIEPAAAADAALHADGEALRAIEAALEAMRATAHKGSAEEKVEADLAFHRAVFAASGNRFIQSAGGAVIHALKANFLMVARADDGSFERNIDNHASLAAAIRKGDVAAAERAATMLLDFNRQDTLRRLGPGSVPDNQGSTDR